MRNEWDWVQKKKYSHGVGENKKRSRRDNKKVKMTK